MGNASIWRGDGTGLRPDRRAGTARGEKGKTLAVKKTGKRFGRAVLSAITRPQAGIPCASPLANRRLEKHPGRLALSLLPPYNPELNPDGNSGFEKQRPGQTTGRHTLRNGQGGPFFHARPARVPGNSQTALHAAGCGMRGMIENIKGLSWLMFGRIIPIN